MRTRSTTRSTVEPYRAGRQRLDVALALAAIANRAYSVALVLFVYDRTHSATWVAAAAAARYLPGIVTASVAPRLLDRYPPRSVMVVANVCCAAAITAMAGAVQAGASPAVPIALAAVVRAAASGQPAAAARLLPVVAGGRDLSFVAARQATVDKIMLLAGPAIGGIVLLVVGPATEMFGLAALVVVAAVISRGLPSPPPARSMPVGHSGLRSHAIAGIGIFVAITAITGWIYGADTVLFAVLAARLRLGHAGYGGLFAGLGAGGLLVAPVVNRLVRKHRLAGWLILGVSIYCLPSVVIAHSHNTFVVVVLEALRGAGSLLVDVVALTELQRVVLPRGLPTLTARLTAVSFAAVAIGAVTTPVLLHVLHTTGTFTMLGVVPPAIALGCYPILRRGDATMARRLEELGPKIATLEPLGLLQATSRPVLERLASAAVEFPAKAGTTVITENDVSDAFYVVSSGDLDVFASGHLINDLHAGDWFGEIGLLEGLRRTATVRAVTDCNLLRIGGGPFLEAFAQLPPSPMLLDSVAARLASSQLDDVTELQLPTAVVD